MRARCELQERDPSARGTTASRSSLSPPYELLLNAIIRSEEMFLSCPTFRARHGEVIVPLGMNDQSWNPDLARDHIGSYRGPMICVMHDPLGAPRHRGSAPRCIGPKLPENSSLTTYRSCRTGREPGASGRHQVRRASPVPSLQVPGMDLSDCAIGVPVLVRFRSEPHAEPALGK